MAREVLTLKKDKEFSLLKGHPWIYREALKTVPEILSGKEVEIQSHKGVYLGRGFFDSESPIAVRLLEGKPEESIRERLVLSLQRAITLRKSLFDFFQTSGYRLLNGEGDGVPGLIIDRYESAIVIQTYTTGLEPYLDLIVQTLLKNLDPKPKWFYRRNQVRQAKTKKEGLIFGGNFPSEIQFKENGLIFFADIVQGQKTGFFLDQRNNRALIKSVAKKRRVANVCGYTGAFSVAAYAGGAREVVTIDSAQPALEQAKKNLRSNKAPDSPKTLICADMFEYLQSLSPDKFDLIILDPPSMAKNRADIQRAVRAYLNLNCLAMSKIAQGGLLFTASCSSQVGRDLFIDTVSEASRKTKRTARILQETHHPPDHPIALSHPEGRYLHGLLLEVC